MMPVTSRKSTRSNYGLRSPKPAVFAQGEQAQTVSPARPARSRPLLISTVRAIARVVAFVAVAVTGLGAMPTETVEPVTMPQASDDAHLVMRGTKSVKDLLEDIKGGASTAAALVLGPEVPDARAMNTTIPGLAEALDAIEAEVDLLLDPLELPNLEPVDAGIVNILIGPETLEDYATTVLGLADDALWAHDNLSQPLRDFTIGTDVKTIRHLLPGYRLAAGLP